MKYNKSIITPFSIFIIFIIFISKIIKYCFYNNTIIIIINYRTITNNITISNIYKIVNDNDTKFIVTISIITYNKNKNNNIITPVVSNE